MGWFLVAWQRAAEFGGRSRRKEYWLFHLINAIVMFAIAIGNGLTSDPKHSGLYFVLLAYAFVSFVPGLSVTIRRLHDTGRSGWWYFIGFIPLIGSIILLVFLVTDSEMGWNAYGPNPKSADAGNFTI